MLPLVWMREGGKMKTYAGRPAALRYIWGGKALGGVKFEDMAEASSEVSLRYIATCLRIVEFLGPLSCWTAENNREHY